MPNKSKKTMLSIKIPELYKAIFRAGKNRQQNYCIIDKVFKKNINIRKKKYLHTQ